jgi:hypothetical protein
MGPRKLLPPWTGDSRSEVLVGVQQAPLWRAREVPSQHATMVGKGGIEEAFSFGDGETQRRAGGRAEGGTFLGEQGFGVGCFSSCDNGTFLSPFPTTSTQRSERKSRSNRRTLYALSTAARERWNSCPTATHAKAAPTPAALGSFSPWPPRWRWVRGRRFAPHRPSYLRSSPRPPVTATIPRSLALAITETTQSHPTMAVCTRRPRK